MYNKVSFYLIKKLKSYQAKRTRQRDLLTTFVLLILLFGGFLFLRQGVSTPIESSSVTSSTDEQHHQITFVGDVMLGRFMQPVYEREGIEGIFSYAQNDWSNSDEVIANLENSVVQDIENTEAYNIDEKRIDLAIDEEVMIDLSEKSGISLFNLANNHMADYGFKGMLETLNIMEENNIAYTGLHMNHTEIDKMYSTIDLNNQKVGIISFSDVRPTGGKIGVLENRPGVILPETQQSLLLERVVRQAKAENDLVFVYAHWGEEYIYEPNTQQKELAAELVDYGADLIVGAHPHIIQPVDFIDGVPVVYSLGNFVFDQGQGSTVSSVIMHVKTDGQSIKELEFLPYRIVNGIPQPEKSKMSRQVTYRKLTKKLQNRTIQHSDYENIKIKVQKE